MYCIVVLLESVRKPKDAANKLLCCLLICMHSYFNECYGDEVANNRRQMSKSESSLLLLNVRITLCSKTKGLEKAKYSCPLAAQYFPARQCIHIFIGLNALTLIHYKSCTVQ